MLKDFSMSKFYPMETYYKVLSIAGSDCSGGAGIQADLKTCSALGVYCMTAITAITAQNTVRISGIENISSDMVGQQIDAIYADIIPDSIKIGMLPTEEIIKTVASQLIAHNANGIILDPVMISTSGYKLISDNAIDALVTKLIPIVDLITPNRHEAELLTGHSITDINDIVNAGQEIIDLGAKAVLIKGGHFDDEAMTDYLFVNKSSEPIGFRSKKINSTNTHGTGCSYSSAIASYFAMGCDLYTSISKAKEYITNAIAEGSNVTIGHGHGSVNHSFNPVKLIKHQL